MLGKRIEELLNKQIGIEAYSSYLYLSMASCAESSGFEGVANWLYAQSVEEREHMLRIIHYINERKGDVVLSAIKQPPLKFESVRSIFEDTLKHEQYVTQSILELVDACVSEKDIVTSNWLRWFVTEQLEEEKSVQNILVKLKLVGNDLYMFDKDIMGLR